MTEEELQVDRLRFSVEKSLRYHQRRRAHFETLHRAMMFAVIVAGSASAADLTHLGVYFAGVTAVIGAADLAYGPGMRARDHLILYQRFASLLAGVVRAGSIVPGQIREWQARRIEIEADEPATFWALEKDCWNEVCHALGRHSKENLYTLTRNERWFMNWFRFEQAIEPNAA